ncbi:HAMP domain-containing sensor histidine kinase [Plantactinospora sp. KBS50]|uniref:sensor histidine kinase n=1 Tax=Plantactinospora sp. KBS50 TaxID=2024580 RepID=UPI000BAAD794|nr:HAMP domain-containing sensor histidine kinase [Plantactinospora sp. KBS50]ASW53901.1 two-component sensor histidine kinase [Plantactinospora sp. KBS50]
MRVRLILLVAATSLLVVVAFLVPLAMLVRSSAADRAVSSAAVETQALAPVVASTDPEELSATVAQVNAVNPHRVTVFLPDGGTVGAPAARSATVDSAVAAGQSVAHEVPGGREILVAVGGLPEGTAVIRTVVPDAELYRGVAGAWAVLGLLGAGLVVVSVLVADQLARSFVRPLAAVAAVSHRMAAGQLDARAAGEGPAEVRAVGAGLNLLAGRVGELLAREREQVADLSHRLRTPLTALRIDAEGLPEGTDRDRVLGDVAALERSVDEIIRTARASRGSAPGGRCDAARVLADRVAFWSALADEERREVRVELDPGPVPVGITADALAAAVDALLDNVFAHTPEGAGCTVRLCRLPGGGARLEVADRGPGLPDRLLMTRGRSGAGSTGLGLDIAARTAAESGGALSAEPNPGGGTVVRLDLGAPAAVRSGRARGAGPRSGSRR